jgi:hypothetical protein
MSALTTAAAFTLIGTALAMGVKSERQFVVEQDSEVVSLIEQSVRQNAAGYDPRVALTMPELKGFSLGQVTIVRSKAGAMLDSAFAGGDRSYDVYARYNEGGSEGCMTLDLEWKASRRRFVATHTGSDDRCQAAW